MLLEGGVALGPAWDKILGHVIHTTRLPRCGSMFLTGTANRWAVLTTEDTKRSNNALAMQHPPETVSPHK